MCGPAAATDRAAAAVEQAESDVAAFGDGNEGSLRPIQLPLGRQVAAVLVGVGVADHDLLPALAALDDLFVSRMFEHGGQGGVRVAEVGDGLEQRHDVDGARYTSRFDVDPHEPDLFEQHGHLEDVADRFGHRDDVVRDRSVTEAAVRRCSFFEHGDFAAGEVGVGGVWRDEPARIAQLGGERVDSGGFVETEVVAFDTGDPEQLGDDDLVHG